MDASSVKSGASLQPIFRVDQATKEFRSGGETVMALQNASIVFPKGKITAILGPNGSGKSTLLGLLGGLFLPDSGDVYFYGYGDSPVSFRELSRKHLQIIRNQMISVIFQGLNLIAHLTVWQNVALPLFVDGISWRKARPEAFEMLRRFGLKEKANKRPSELSGGQQQRVAVCRALVGDFQVILADEPTARLDGESTEALMAVLRELCQERQISVIMATHDKALVKAHCDCAVLCQKGIEGNSVGERIIPVSQTTE